ncbi:MAG: O-antigen/teichoic acid export membrane protein [Cellvibrionaceae bacterium]|jgi:O-antigen/teichoic acid export membrane protein
MTPTKQTDETSNIKRLVRNLTYLMGSQLATWAMAVISIAIIPRYLGSANFGELSLAGSIWIIASVFTIFGLSTHLTKTIARNSNKVSTFYGTALTNIVFNFLLTFGAVMLYSWLSGYSATQMQIIVIIGIGSFSVTVGSLTSSTLVGLEKMDVMSSIETLNKAIYTIASITTILLGGNLFQFVIVGVIANVIATILMIIGLYRVQPFTVHYDFTLSRELYKAGAPYFLTIIFAMLYKEFDMVIMSWLLPDSNQLGWYTAADRLFGTMMFVPGVLITALFPLLSRLHGEKSGSLSAYLSKSFNLLFLISIPIGLGVSAIAEPIILLFYGEGFIEAAQILKVLGFVLILTYQTTLLGNFLISIDKQRIWTITMAIATLATIPLDLVLVPYANTFGVAGVGGALAYVFTEGGMMIAGLYFLPREAITKTNLILALKAIVAGAVMYMAVIWLNRYGLVWSVISGVIIYPTLILLFKTISAEDTELLKSLAAPITNRLSRSKN